jgi:hypothetical protein
MPDCDAICQKLLLCSQGSEGVAKQSMKAMPKSGKIQATGEKLVALMETICMFEMQEAFSHDEKVAIIHEADEIEEYGPTVMDWLVSNHTPSNSETDDIFQLYVSAIATLTELLDAKVVGWDQ